MFLVLMVCLAGVVAAVFHGTLQSMKLFVVLSLVSGGCTCCFGACGCSYVVMMVRGQMACLWFLGGRTYHFFGTLILLLHLMCQLPPEVPAGWQTAKIKKYSSSTTTFHFSPLCVETLGAWGSCARSLVRRISRVMGTIGQLNF